MKTLKTLCLLIFLSATLTATAQTSRSNWLVIAYGYDYTGKAIIADDAIILKNCYAANEDDYILEDWLLPIKNKIEKDMENKYSHMLSDGNFSIRFCKSKEEWDELKYKLTKRIGGIEIKDWQYHIAPKLYYSCQ